MKLQTFFFPQQTHGKIFFSVVWPAWKLATAASFPGSDSSALTAWVRSSKGTRNLHVTQAYLPPCSRAVLVLPLCIWALQEGGWVVWFSRRIMRCSRVTWDCWESGSYSRSLPLASLDGLWWEEQICLMQDEAPDLLNVSSWWMPWNWAAGDGRQTALGIECGCNN